MTEEQLNQKARECAENIITDLTDEGIPVLSESDLHEAYKAGFSAGEAEIKRLTEENERLTQYLKDAAFRISDLEHDLQNP